MKVAGVRAGQDHRRCELDREDMRALVDDRDHRDGLRRPAHRRLLRDAAAVADRRVLRRLPARRRPTSGSSRRRDDPGRADRVDGPGRPRQQHHAPPVPRALLDPALRARRRPRRPRRRTSTRRSAAPIPALREADRVLAILAEQRRDDPRPLRATPTRVVGRAAPTSARTSRASSTRRATPPRASRRARDGIRAPVPARCPTFLRELRPTMRAPRRGRRRADARAAQPAPRRAACSSASSTTLGPFAEASRPGVPHARRRRASRAAARSRPRAPASPSCGRGVDDLPEAAQNLAITLEHLDDPTFAIEKDPRAGRGGGGYTGLEALLRYIFAPVAGDQPLRRATSYMLKVVAVPRPRRARTTRTPSRSRTTRRTSAAARGSARTSPASRRPTRRRPRGAATRDARDARRRARPRAPAADDATADGRAPERGDDGRAATAARAAGVGRCPTRRRRRCSTRSCPSVRCPTARRRPTSGPRRRDRGPPRLPAGRHEARAPASDRRQPRPRRGGHRARRRRRGVPRLQREQGPAVRPDDDS